MRVVTWNLAWRFIDWETRQDAIGRVLGTTDADVIAVQETWPGQLERLADDLQMDWAFSGRRPDERIEHGFGNGILARRTIRRTAEITLPSLRGPAYRSALLAELDGPNPAVVVTTHLTHRYDESATRVAQLQALSDFVEDNLPEQAAPIVLLGDLNAVPDSDEIRRLTGRSTPYRDGVVWSDAWEQVGDGPGLTWTTDNPHAVASTWPNRRIDYVLTRWPRNRPQGNPVAATRIGMTPVDGVIATDHWGVQVDLAD